MEHNTGCLINFQKNLLVLNREFPENKVERQNLERVEWTKANSLVRQIGAMAGGATLQGAKYRNTVKQIGQYRNTVSKIHEIPTPHLFQIN